MLLCSRLKLPVPAVAAMAREFYALLLLDVSQVTEAAKPAL